MERSQVGLNAQYVTEEVLPNVISVEESKCLLCNRQRKFYSCRQCRDDENVSFFTQVSAKGAGRENQFPGVINGLAQCKITELRHCLERLKEYEKRNKEEASLLDKKEKLKIDIIIFKKRIKFLKTMHESQIAGTKKLLVKKKNMELALEQLHRRSQRTMMKKSKITEYMDTKKYVIEKTQASLKKEIQLLADIRKQQVDDLVKYIFPIVGISQDENLDSDESPAGDEPGGESISNILERELAEARRLYFVHGRWIYDQREGPDLVRISISSNKVHAPADGNYAMCEAWLKNLLLSGDVTDSSTSSQSSEDYEVHKATGASIYAALTLATHLMHTLWKILNFHVPYKLHYRQFCKPNLTVQEFLWIVHKLNGNVLAFCLRYGVQPRLIHPLHTLPNIQNAVQVFLHNGDNGPSSSLAPELVISLEEALDESSDPLPEDDEEKMEESLSEWENSFADEDWELQITRLPEFGQHQYTSAAPFQSLAQQQIDLQESQGLMSSAVAWVTKGWWTK